jgi:hypothetical protein
MGEIAVAASADCSRSCDRSWRQPLVMAFDRTPSPPTLEPETIRALRDALTRSVDSGNHSDELRHLLRTAASEARDKGILAERLLIILKDVWYSLPTVASAKSTAAENKLLQELISRCIHEYYAA